MAICDVSVVCSQQFPVDCAIVELAEELKKIAYFGGFFIALKTLYVFFMFLAFHMVHKG